ncbi:MAG: hypothetical protein U9N01_04365 [Euryarchaeota archaeon]|nr:hypothetical protein [Euryarchaeota archaeon]
MNFESCYDGYNLPSSIWMKERKEPFERAFNFAREESKQNEK